MATILDLPDEIFLNIFDFLYYIDNNFKIYGNKKNLLPSRLVCKRLATIVKSLLFQYITFINDIKGYKRLLLLSQSSAANNVRYLSCCIQVFKIFTKEHTEQSIIMQNTYKTFKPRYLPRYRQQTRLQARGLDTGILNKAISSFKSLHSIKIIPNFCDKFTEAVSSIVFSRRSFPAYSPLEQRLFEAIISAISNSQINIKGFQLGNIKEDQNFEDSLNQPPIITTIQGFSIIKCGIYQQVFQQLKQLRISLPVALEYNGLLTTIHSAPFLEELWLQCDEFSGDLTSNFLKPLKLPRLQILRLDLARIEDSFCLIDFLGKHATSLRIISFHKLNLKTGSWEFVFIKMKTLLTLSTVCIRGAFQIESILEIKPGLIEHGRTVLSDEAIEDFIQCKTDNNSFDLLRSARRDFPPHSLGDWQCWDGCPYRPNIESQGI